MKELEQHSKVSTEAKQVAPIRKQSELLGKMRFHRGHKCYEINTVTDEVAEHVFKGDDIRYNLILGKVVTRKIDMKKDCIYITALNKENAMKKYKKLKISL
jgi:hypothetical protein